MAGNTLYDARGNVLWQNTAIPDGFTDEIVMAAGAGNQRLYVIRALGMVIVRQAPVRSSEGRDTFSDKEFLSLILK